MNKVCDKCGCTEFTLGTFCIDVGGLPYIDSVYYCKECGEMYKEDRKHYKKLNIEVKQWNFGSQRETNQIIKEILEE